MGNKASRRRHIVDDRYTRPQGLYEHINLDHRKLKRLIKNHQLAPCFPGVEDPSVDLDECPICFLSYPSLNRSKCCTKSICTECYLQIKSSHTVGPTKCPFCKTLDYSVEYRGAKTLEEKGMEQVEEQKVIEAKIRIRQKELYDDGRQMLRQDGEYEGSVTFPSPPVPTAQSLNYFAGGMRSDPGGEAMIHGQDQGFSGPSFNREGDGDFDLEDLMLMEAIWLSIQDHEQSQQQPVLDLEERLSRAFNPSENTTKGKSHSSTRPVSVGATRTGAFVGAIASMTEEQNDAAIASNQGSSSRVMDRISDINHSYGLKPINTAITHVPTDRSNYTRQEWNNIQHTVGGGEEIRQFHQELRAVEGLNNWIEMPAGNRPRIPPVSRNNQETTSDWMPDDSLEMAVAETSSINSVHSAFDLRSETPSESHHALQERTTCIVPESFEDQIKLALALSLADAQANMRQRG